MSFATTLYAYLRQSGLSQNKLAFAAGIDMAYVNRLCNNKQVAPKREVVDSLARAMNLTPFEHAHLVCAAGYLPHTDDEFQQVVSRIAAHWLAGGFRTPDLENDPGPVELLARRRLG